MALTVGKRHLPPLHDNRATSGAQALWQFDFVEVTGHNLETRGRKEVNRLLQSGWRLLSVYTLRYEDSGIWRERPMAILGRVRDESSAPPRESQLPPESAAAIPRVPPLHFRRHS